MEPAVGIIVGLAVLAIVYMKMSKDKGGSNNGDRPKEPPRDSDNIL